VGWTPRPTADTLRGVPARNPDDAAPLTPLEYLAFEPLRAQSASAKLVWLHIAQHGRGAYTVRAINEALGLTVATTQAALAALKAAGLVEGTTGTSHTPSDLRAVKPAPTKAKRERASR
jgi:predicted Rossmann fold nucleotide-binding protein DprA/Smf involved in DNA uptake